MSGTKPTAAPPTARLSRACVMIIVVASVERFAYKGVASNLVTYLTEVVEMSTSAAAKSVSAWSGVTSMLPLLTAVLADSYWDRYSTITASSLLYVVVSYSDNLSLVLIFIMEMVYVSRLYEQAHSQSVSISSSFSSHSLFSSGLEILDWNF
jgi:dipeptide/tripeptide permease